MKKNALLLKKVTKIFGGIEKSSYLCTRKSEISYALVAQLVEHLTLNQGVQGSSPCRRTEDRSIKKGCACSSVGRAPDS